MARRSRRSRWGQRVPVEEFGHTEIVEETPLGVLWARLLVLNTRVRGARRRERSACERKYFASKAHD